MPFKLVMPAPGKVNSLREGARGTRLVGDARAAVAHVAAYWHRAVYRYPVNSSETFPAAKRITRWYC
jgi:hypothetical protein